MGRTKKIRLIIRTSHTHQFLGEWQIKYAGKPTEANLSKWRDGFNQSLLKGGANEHLTTSYWIQTDLEIFNQITGQIVCTYHAPMFEVIP